MFLLSLILRNWFEFSSSYNNRKNFHKLVFTLMSWQFAMMVLLSIYSNRKLFWKAHLEIIDFHKMYAEKGKKILFDYYKKMRFCNKLFAISIITNVTGCIFFPIFDSTILGNKKTLALGFLIPYTNPDKNFGYACNFFFQNIQICMVGYGYVVFIRIYWLYFAHACARIDILRSIVDELNENITESYIEQQSKILSLKLKEIVKLHTAYLRFVLHIIPLDL